MRTQFSNDGAFLQSSGRTNNPFVKRELDCLGSTQKRFIGPAHWVVMKPNRVSNGRLHSPELCREIYSREH